LGPAQTEPVKARKESVGASVPRRARLDMFLVVLFEPGPAHLSTRTPLRAPSPSSLYTCSRPPRTRRNTSSGCWRWSLQTRSAFAW